MLDLLGRLDPWPEGIHDMILEINANLRSRSSVIGERGDDRGDVDREIAADNASLAANNIQPGAAAP